MNPLYSSLSNGFVGNISQLKQMYKNPMMALTQMAKSNPQLQPIIQAINNGADPKQLVMNECQKRGIDFNQFMNQLK